MAGEELGTSKPAHLRSRASIIFAKKRTGLRHGWLIKKHRVALPRYYLRCIRHRLRDQRRYAANWARAPSRTLPLSVSTMNS